MCWHRKQKNLKSLDNLVGIVSFGVMNTLCNWTGAVVAQFYKQTNKQTKTQHGIVYVSKSAGIKPLLLNR